MPFAAHADESQIEHAHPVSRPAWVRRVTVCTVHLPIPVPYQDPRAADLASGGFLHIPAERKSHQMGSRA